MSRENNGVQKVGPHTLRKVTPGPTSAGIMPTYAICTPDRWGMRYSDVDPERKGQLMYPVARDYAKEIYEALIEKVKWGDIYLGKKDGDPELQLTWPIRKEQEDGFFDLIRSVMTDALTNESGGFGINPRAIPKLSSYAPVNVMEQGAFSMEYWQMQISFLRLKILIESKDGVTTDNLGRLKQLAPIRALADTIYHESRHCQQDFWILALIQQYPDNFKDIPNITKWPNAMGMLRKDTTARPSEIISLTSKQPIPTDTAALISLKRMALGLYVYYLDIWRKGNYYPNYLSGMPEIETEFQHARAAAIEILQNVGLGGSAINVDEMLGEPPSCAAGYSGRPWENDAFVCGDMATSYWDAMSGGKPKTYPADQCSHEYEMDFNMHKRNQSLGLS